MIRRKGHGRSARSRELRHIACLSRKGFVIVRNHDKGGVCRLAEVRGPDVIAMILSTLEGIPESGGL